MDRAGAAAVLASRSSATLLGDLQPAIQSLRHRRERLVRPVQADEPHQPLLQRRDPAHGRHGASRTAPTRPASPCSRSSGTRWSAFASDAQGFDGNGSYTRTATGGGDILIQHRQALGPPEEPRRPVRARARPAARARGPKRPSKQAALQDQRRLLQEREAQPQRARGGRRDRRTRWATVRLAIQKNLRDFIAVIVMVDPGAGRGRLHPVQPALLPARLGAGARHRLLRAEGASSRPRSRSRPGQGQTVDIAGVPVGEIKKVDLEDGRAVVTMAIQQKYADMIKRDATHAAAARRPASRTWSSRWTRARQTLPAVEEGYTIPVAQTEPDVNLDEILASLDRDTRDYLRLLVAGGGEGLKNNGPRLRERVPALRAAQPRRREAHRRSCASAARTSARLIHNLQLLVTEVGTQGQGARRAGRLPERRLRGVRQPGRATCASPALLPARARDDQQGAGQVRRADRSARPDAARAAPGRARARAGASARQRPFARQTIPPIKNQIRPFARAGAADGRGAEAGDAATSPKVTPKLATTFDVLNKLFNALAYNPQGPRRGLPVLGLLAEPHRRVGLLDPGRPRPDQARHHLHRLHRARRARGDRARSTPSSAR